MGRYEIMKGKVGVMKKEIGQRIKEERNRQNLNQEQLIQEARLPWERQTLGQVENGERELKAWELARIAQVLHIEMSSFFSQKEVSKQPIVLWRVKPENPQHVQREFIRLCKDYKFVEDLISIDKPVSRNLPRKVIALNSFNQKNAYALAEEIRSELNLGDYPAASLVKTLEERFGIKFFFNDMGGNGSAASSVSDYGNCILISSSEPVWRQHFSLAHELFHIITWDENILMEIEKNEKLRIQNEKLADAFAAGLLVPSEILHHEILLLAKNDKSLNEAGIVAIARQFGVSLEALLWRMVHTGFISSEQVKLALADEKLRVLDKEIRTEMPMNTYQNNRFVRLAYLAYGNGEISWARLSKILRTPLSDLTQFLRSFGLAEVNNNEITLSYS